MKRELLTIVRDWQRVEAGDFSLPGRIRLLESLNDRLKPILDLDPLTDDLSRAGLTFKDWLAAVELARRLITSLIHLEG
jgi:hypothetical protein